MSLSIIVSLSILIIFQLFDLNHSIMGGGSNVTLFTAPFEKKMWAIEMMIILALVTSITLICLNYYSFTKHTTSSFFRKQNEKGVSTLPVKEMAVSLSRLIEEQKKIEEELRMREEWLSTALTSIAHAVITTDAKGHITFINPTAEKLTGWKKHEALATRLDEIYQILDGKTGEKTVHSLIDFTKHSSHTIQSLLLTRQGMKLYIESSIALMKNKKKEWIGWVLVFQDITEQKRTVENIKNQTLTDELTGLPNRRFFQQEMRRLRKENTSLAVLFLDLDRFKSVNDSFGHKVGDLLLKGVAERLRASWVKKSWLCAGLETNLSSCCPESKEWRRR